jgi:uncharacterized FlaG/YvyC family protein
MSTDFSIKPVGAPVATPVVQVASDAANDAVATELPVSQSVTVPDASASASNNLQSSSDYISRQAFFDSAAASIVYQVVNDQTDQVVNQFPDEAVLRRRAYYHTLDLTKDEPTRLLATDRTA